MESVRQESHSEGRMGQFLAILVVVLGFSLGFSVPALQPFIHTEFDFSVLHLAVATALFYGCAAAASIFAGRVVETYGPPLGMCASFGLVGLGFGLVAMAPHWVVIFLGMGIGGVGNAFSVPASNALLAFRAATGGLGLRFGIRQASVPAAAIIAGLSATATAAGGSWRGVPAGVATASAVVALVLGFQLRLVGTVETRTVYLPEPAGGEWRRHVPLFSVAFVAGIVGTAIPAFFVVSLIALDERAGEAGLALTVGSLAGVVARIAWGWLADRTPWPPTALLALVVALGGLSAALFPFHPGGAWVYVASASVFALAMGHGGLFFLVVSEAARGRTARFTGNVQAAVHSGGVAGPLVFAVLISLTGFSGAWVVLGGISVAAGAYLAVSGTPGLRTDEGKPLVDGMEMEKGQVYTNANSFDRASLAELARLGVATVHECMDHDAVMDPGIRPVIPGSRIAGRAVTVQNSAGHNLGVHVGLSLAGPGDVLVMTSGDDAIAAYGMWGGVVTTCATARGVGGVVTDGFVRDVDVIRGETFPVWSGGISPRSGGKESLDGVNLPVVCGGVSVNPGDVVVADGDGVVVVRADEVDAVLDAARRREAKEAQLMEELRTGSVTTYELMGLGALAEAGTIRFLGHAWEGDA